MKIKQELPDTPENQWRFQLDDFARDNQQELAGLFWGLLQEWGDGDDILGIDLKPTPHFVACPKQNIRELNRKVGGYLQEILGLLDNYKPEAEVAILAIGEGQIKLIYFQPEIPPPVCFKNLGNGIDGAIENLERLLAEAISL
jgi:hypothetical protein